MARLPSERYLMQQIGGRVVLFEDFTEREITSFDPANSITAATALEQIVDSDDLGDEDKCYASFWAGYFHFYAGPDAEMTRTEADPVLTEDGMVLVSHGGIEVVRFDPCDDNATAMAQLPIHECGLIPNEKARAHFWCGFFYAHASGGSDA
jgi:hypothetical protein